MRRGLILKKEPWYALLIMLLLSVMSVAGISEGSSSKLKPGTVYTRNSAGEQVIAYNAGHSYSLDKDGHVIISYSNGKSKVKAPLTLIPGYREDSGMSEDETGFFISIDKTAITYGGSRGTPVQVLISNDQGKTWNTYPVTQELIGTTKNIGFITKNEGWLVLSRFNGMGSENHYIYKTRDGGKSWSEVKGNANSVYARVLTGAGFASDKIGFMGFRYETDFQPAICWTQDGGESWTKLHIKLPDSFADYSLTPLSPVFDGATGQFPIQLSKDGASNVVGTVYLTSQNYGKTWKYNKVVFR
ncbi:WD40/YVTN/BNR-like repeat-containing protein [Paenibacillus sp. sgz5001063]|uniref:WD40/YVTN/BNR-like repeat-containing protein n=1 Tax=Paenibacillus sp. sgz5001063 TaxID=3242474 RepID=UPI0036D221C4